MLCCRYAFMQQRKSVHPAVWPEGASHSVSIHWPSGFVDRDERRTGIVRFQDKSDACLHAASGPVEGDLAVLFDFLHFHGQSLTDIRELPLDGRAWFHRAAAL